MKLHNNPYHRDDLGECGFPPSETKQNGFVSPRDLLAKYASGQDLSAYANGNRFSEDPTAPVLRQGADLVDQLRFVKRLQAEAAASHAVNNEQSAEAAKASETDGNKPESVVKTSDKN